MTVVKQAGMCEPQRFRWQLNNKVLLFVAVFLPLTITLGFWQLGRAEEKKHLLEHFRARETAAPVDLALLHTEKDHQYRRVFIRGTFENGRTVLLDNRVRHGAPGYEVVTLFKPAESNLWLWVNRGWIQGSPDRRQLPQIPPLQGSLLLRGSLYKSDKAPYVVGEETWRAIWPQVLQNLDMEDLSVRLNRPFFPYQLRLDQDSSGALETGWPVVNIMPEKHRAYAAQWFAMAIALTILCLFANSNLGVVLGRNFRQKGEKKQ